MKLEGMVDQNLSQCSISMQSVLAVVPGPTKNKKFHFSIRVTLSEQQRKVMLVPTK